jgi:hypothetical protein
MNPKDNSDFWGNKTSDDLKVKELTELVMNSRLQGRLQILQEEHSVGSLS